MTITSQQVDAWDAEVDAAYEAGRQEGMKQERALWELSKLGQEIEADPSKIGCVQHDCDECKARLAQPEQDDRRLQIAMRQWEDWKTYALELQKKLVKYEGGSPMILNTQPQRPWVGLTEDEINDAYRCAAEAINFCTPSHTLIARSVEAKLKEKNTCQE